MDQKFHGDDENTRESPNEIAQWPTAKIRPKSQNSNTRHDGILSIGNFMLMINNHFARFQLPGNLFKTKKMCSLFSWQHAISYLLKFDILRVLPIQISTKKGKLEFCEGNFTVEQLPGHFW
jgi:hypothetical protein